MKHFDDLRRDKGVGAVIFTGAGTRAFAAGADINGLRDYIRATANRLPATTPLRRDRGL